MVKTIKDVDEKAWRMFAGLCKMKGVKIGNELTSLLNDYVKKNLK